MLQAGLFTKINICVSGKENCPRGIDIALGIITSGRHYECCHSRHGQQKETCGKNKRFNLPHAVIPVL